MASGAARTFIVEDHPFMRQVLADYVRRVQDLVLIGTADSGEDALRQLPELEPALVLVDLSLPGISGLQVIEALQRDRPQSRCLVVTGHEDPLYAQQAQRSGAAGFVVKGDLEELNEAVRLVLAGESYFS